MGSGASNAVAVKTTSDEDLKKVVSDLAAEDKARLLKALSAEAPNADLMENIMLLSDSYKTSHWRQYPAGTTTIYSYFESRGGQFDEVCWFGLQYFLKKYLVGQVVTKEKIDMAEKIVNGHMGVLDEMKHFNREGWEYILNTHGGKLPIVIKAAPEGMVVPVKNVLMTVVNTDPKCFWLTNYLETLLVQVWYPMTVATLSRENKKSILEYHSKTGCSMGMLDIAYMLNDFGVRGVSSMETSRLGGAGHLVNFGGSDNMPGLCTAIEYYKADLAGFGGMSVPAAEHSTITSWSDTGEAAAMKNMLTQYPKGVVAVVSDSYDIFNAVENIWGKELKEMILSRPPPMGRLVIRPDSGDPKTIVVQVLDLLEKNFEIKTNEAGFKTLPHQIRVIQGDGVSHESIKEIYEHMVANKWAASNLVFGSGGALLQKMNRDTQKCAFKCCEAIVDDKPRNVYKDPVTDKGKQSKKGQLKLVKQDGKVTTLTEGAGNPEDDLLVEVFRDGALMKEWSFDEVRKLSEDGLIAKIWS